MGVCAMFFVLHRVQCFAFFSSPWAFIDLNCAKREMCWFCSVLLFHTGVPSGRKNVPFVFPILCALAFCDRIEWRAFLCDRARTPVSTSTCV